MNLYIDVETDIDKIRAVTETGQVILLGYIEILKQNGIKIGMDLDSIAREELK